MRFKAPKGALTPDLKAELQDARDALAALLAERAAAAARDPVREPIVPAPEARHEPFPLTDMQQAYWLGQTRFFELGNLNPHWYVEVDVAPEPDGSEVDLDRIRRVTARLVERHEMLRAVVLPDGRQRILERVPPVAIDVLELRRRGADEAAAELAALRRRMCDVGPTTDAWPLFELVAARLPDGATRLAISVSLLVFDGLTFGILAREAAALWKDAGAALPPLELSYRDYVLRLGEIEKSPAYEAARRHWLERLDELPPGIELPLARDPRSIETPSFRHRTFRLERDAWAAFKARAQALGVSPAAALCAAYTEVLGTWSTTPRFTLDVMVAHRLPVHAQVLDVVGNFSTTLLLAVDRAAGGTFAERAHRVQERLWSDLDHALFSGVRVLRERNRSLGGSAHVGAPVVFACTLDAGSRTERGIPALDALTFTSVQTPQVWIDHQAVEDDAGRLLVNWDSVDDLFPERLVDDVFAAYERLVRRLAAEPAAWERTSFEMAPAYQLEQRALVNATDAELPVGLLHEPFLAQAARRPDQPAIVSRSRRLSYGELREASRRVAHRLRRLGARPGRLVGVVMEKGWEQAAAVLGILEAGAAYLPIAPSFPAERLRYLLEHGEARIALTQSHLVGALAWPEGVTVLAVDALAPEPGDEADLEPVGAPDDLAYVIFTSGSTGQPKGVMIDHRGALNTCVDVNRRYGVGPDDRVLALSALNFDLSVWDLFGALGAGATVVIPDEDKRRDPAHWARLVEQERVTVWNSVPALMSMLTTFAETLPAGFCSTLRLVLLSGDWIPVTLPDAIRRLADGVEVHSLGGATEASIWSIAYPIGEVPSDWRSIPYGKAMVNQRMHVLDRDFLPCPVWAPGEIYIGGVGLSLGYWKDPAKTAAAFVRHPQTGERLYRTGDLGRFLPSGDIEFLGREDFQVKIRGHRIELGEIEAALAKHEALRGVVVDAVGDRSDARIVAYVVPNELMNRIHWRSRCLVEREDGTQLEGTTVDVSLQAIRLRVAEERAWRDDEKVVLFLDFPGVYGLVRMVGRPIWWRGRDLGVRFEASMAADPRLEAGFANLLAEHGIPFVDRRTIVEPGREASARPAPARLPCFAELGGALCSLTTESLEGETLTLSGLRADGDVGDPIELELRLPGMEADATFGGEIAWRAGDRIRVAFPHDASARACVRRASELVLRDLGESLTRFTLPELRADLRRRLPDYMVPASFVLLDEIPLTPNGKVDRKALPAPEADVAREAPASHQPPRTPLETELVALWEELLDVRPIGVASSFFELGGDSLRAVRLLVRIRGRFGRELGMATLLEDPTVEHLAAVLGAAAPAGAASPVVAVQGKGHAAPFYCVHPVGGTVMCYRALAVALGEGRPFLALQAPGVDGDEEPLDQVEQLAARYLAAIREARPEPPRLLGGWSMGGIVAFEMARQLRAAGAPVDAVVMIDTRLPTRPVALDAAALWAAFLRDLERPLGRGPSLAAPELRAVDEAEHAAFALRRAQEAGVLPADLDAERLARLFGTFAANTRAMWSYRPTPIDAPLVVLDASDEVPDERYERDATARWSALAKGEFRLISVPGDHYSTVMGSDAASTAAQLREILDAAGGPAR